MLLSSEGTAECIKSFGVEVGDMIACTSGTIGYAVLLLIKTKSTKRIL